MEGVEGQFSRSVTLWAKTAVGLARPTAALIYRRRVLNEDRSWERFELLILQWVIDASPGMNWRFDRSDDSSEEVPSLSGLQLDEGLRRLKGFRLIAARRQESSGYFYWSGLRPTANGLRVLGEWPPGPEASVGTALVRVLRELAEQSDEPEAKAFRRAAGAVGRFGDDIVTDAAKGELRRFGGALGS